MSSSINYKTESLGLFGEIKNTFDRCSTDWLFVSTCVHLAPIVGVLGITYAVPIFKSDVFNTRYGELKRHLLNKELSDIAKKSVKLSAEGYCPGAALFVGSP